MCAGTLVHISRHLDKTSNNNKRCQLWIRCMICEECCHQILHRISGLWSLLYYTCSYPLLPLVFYSTSLLLLSYHTMRSLCLISLAIYLLSPACLCHDTVFKCMFIIQIIDKRVIIFARHLALASPLAREFWLLWILMSRSWSLRILPVADLRGAAIAWIISRPSRAPSFQALLLGSRVFLWWLWASFCTVHTCTSLCILAFAPISDVIFLQYLSHLVITS